MLLSALTERTLPTLSLLLRRPALLAMLASPLPSLLWMPSSLSLSLTSRSQRNLASAKHPTISPLFRFQIQKKRETEIADPERERERERERWPHTWMYLEGHLEEATAKQLTES